MADSAAEIIYGAAPVASFDVTDLRDRFALLQKHNVKTLDTASFYPNSEDTLGKNDAPKKFIIHTKAPAVKPGCLSKQSVLDGMEKSLKDLRVDSVDLYYLHNPDTTTPIEETLSAIQELYAAGKFKRFGVSNFTASDVQKIYDIQSAAKSVLPTAYQGNYNAVARHSEKTLFPLLRKLKMNFYAYSPIAGGFLVKNSAQIRSKESDGRFSTDSPLYGMYNGLYGKESMFIALDEWGLIAGDAGISKAALAYRWVKFHSGLVKGDGIIIGASRKEQLEETLKAFDAGPLEAGIAKRASDVWETVKKDAPQDNWQDYLSLQ